MHANWISGGSTKRFAYEDFKGISKQQVRDNCPPTLAEAIKIARSLKAADEAEKSVTFKSYEEQCNRPALGDPEQETLQMGRSLSSKALRLSRA